MLSGVSPMYCRSCTCGIYWAFRQLTMGVCFSLRAPWIKQKSREAGLFGPRDYWCPHRLLPCSAYHEKHSSVVTVCAHYPVLLPNRVRTFKLYLKIFSAALVVVSSYLNQWLLVVKLSFWGIIILMQAVKFKKFPISGILMVGYKLSRTGVRTLYQCWARGLDLWCWLLANVASTGPTSAHQPLLAYWLQWFPFIVNHLEKYLRQASVQLDQRAACESVLQL